MVEARQRGREVAALVGFSAAEQTLIATAISEVTRNIVSSPTRGEVVISAIRRRAPRGERRRSRCGTGDRGPGPGDAGRVQHLSRTRPRPPRCEAADGPVRPRLGARRRHHGDAWKSGCRDVEQRGIPRTDERDSDMTDTSETTNRSPGTPARGRSAAARARRAPASASDPLRQQWAERITEAHLLSAMTAQEVFSEATSVYDNYVEVLETGSVEALQHYARDLSERIIPRGVETHEVVGIVLLLRDVLARSLFEKYREDFDLLNRVLGRVRACRQPYCQHGGGELRRATRASDP